MAENEQTTNTAAVATVDKDKRVSLVAALGMRYGMEAGPFLETIKKTVMPTKDSSGNALTPSNEQIAAFMAVCHEYDLNPFTREIFAFPTKGGGIQPVVSIDGRLKYINKQADYDGMDISMEMKEDKKTPYSCTVLIHRKGFGHATPVTEYYDECFRPTDPWKQMPRRMLRHKAIKEASRVVYGLTVPDEDEAIDMVATSDGSFAMESATKEKTEALKDKIGAKKSKAAEKAAAAAPATTVTEQPAQPQEPIQQPQAPAQEPAQEAAPAEPVAPQAPSPDPETVINAEDKKRLIDTLIAKAGNDKNGKTAKVQDQTRAKLFELGYTKMAELKYKDFQGMMDWATALTL